jgi:hypothetical protein
MLKQLLIVDDNDVGRRRNGIRKREGRPGGLTDSLSILLF